MRTSPTKARAGMGWVALFLVTFLAAYFYVLVEWLFVITKPSYLQYLRLAEQIEIFLFSGALLALGAFILLAPLWLLQRLLRQPSVANAVLWLACLIPGFLSAALLLVSQPFGVAGSASRISLLPGPWLMIRTNLWVIVT